MKKNIKKWLFIDLIVLFVGVGYYLATYFLGQTCLIKWIIKKECPTCGMSRAILCLLKGDIRGYFSFNYLALPTLIGFYALLHVSERTKKFVNIYAVILAVCILIKFIFT